MLGKKKFRQDGGFSMVELMFALVILAVGLMAIIQLQVSAMASLAKARHQSVAVELAGTKMELLKTLPYQVDKPADPPLDASGQPIVDASGRSVFYDNITFQGDQGEGDGRATLHWDFPVDKNGKRLQATGAYGAGEMGYIVMWSIERGGSQGTPWPGTTVKSPPYVPGPNQMRIRVIVGWFERYQQEIMGKTAEAFDGSKFPAEFDAFEPDSADDFHHHLMEMLPDRVELECVRDLMF